MPPEPYGEKREGVHGSGKRPARVRKAPSVVVGKERRLMGAGVVPPMGKGRLDPGVGGSKDFGSDRGSCERYGVSTRWPGGIGGSGSRKKVRRTWRGVQGKKLGWGGWRVPRDHRLDSLPLIPR